ncbi:hypothetical protein, partial [Escherichia coli]
SHRQKQKKLIMLPSETMIWQPEFTDKTLSRKPGAVHSASFRLYSSCSSSKAIEFSAAIVTNLSALNIKYHMVL